MDKEQDDAVAKAVAAAIAEKDKEKEAAVAAAVAEKDKEKEAAVMAKEREIRYEIFQEERAFIKKLRGRCAHTMLKFRVDLAM